VRLLPSDTGDGGSRGVVARSAPRRWVLVPVCVVAP
jgi:hypothetical protein